VNQVNFRGLRYNHAVVLKGYEKINVMLSEVVVNNASISSFHMRLFAGAQGDDRLLEEKISFHFRP
jgi:hypothetical protein